MDMLTDIAKEPVAALASIRIFGIGLDFEDISRRLGVQPSETHRRGERGLVSTPYSKDMWCLDSPHPRTDPLEKHLAWLRQVLLPHYDFLRSLKETCEVSSYCGITAGGNSCRFRIPHEAFGIFVEIGIDMDLSLIFVGYSDLRIERADVKDLLHSVGSGASLQIVGSRLDLTSISEALGVPPSAFDHYDKFGTKDGHSNNLWSVASPLPRTEELDAHLRWLAGLVLRSHDSIRAIRKEVELFVQCNVVTKSDTGTVSISPEGLKLCTELDLPLDFSAFLLPEPE
jgi:Domain of unknown function (DUF4279)